MKCFIIFLLQTFLSVIVFTQEIVCQKQDFIGHLQGIAADKTGIYWSFYDTVVKTDYSGKITASATVPIHAGDLCVKDGKIYLSVVYYTPADIQKDGGSGWVYVYDQALQFKRKIALPNTPRPDGITCTADRFSVAGDDFGKELHSINTISVYSADWKFQEKIRVDIGFPTAYGAQTLNIVGNRMLAAFYAKGKGTHWLSLPDLKQMEPIPFSASVGFAVLPPEIAKGRELYLLAKSTGSRKEKKFGGKALIYENRNGTITPAEL